MHHVSQMLQCIGPRIAFDGVHIAKQLGNNIGLQRIGVLDQCFIFFDKLRRTGDEFVKLLLIDRQNLTNDFQLAFLLTSLGGQFAQLSHIAHAEHQADDHVVVVGDSRPTQFKAFDPTIRHGLLELSDHQVRVELEVHDVFADAGATNRLNLRERIGAQIGVSEQQVHHFSTSDLVGFKDGFKVGRIFGVDQTTINDGENPLRHVLQHGLNIIGFLP